MSWDADFKALDDAERILIEGNKRAVRASAARIQARTQNNAPSPQNPGPYATGATRASVYKQTDEGSDYDEAVAAARKLDSNAAFTPSGNIATLAGEGQAEAAVGVATSHAPFVENGHYNIRSGSYVAPQPFLAPSVEADRAELEADLEQVLKNAGFDD